MKDITIIVNKKVCSLRIDGVEKKRIATRAGKEYGDFIAALRWLMRYCSSDYPQRIAEVITMIRDVEKPPRINTRQMKRAASLLMRMGILYAQSDLWSDSLHYMLSPLGRNFSLSCAL